MSAWSDKEIKLLKKLLKKGKSDKDIAMEFERKGYNKNVFMIISKKRSTPELRPYFQESEWTMGDLDGFQDELKKQKKK